MKNSFIISLLVFILYMMASCRTEYIPIESVRYDSVFLEKIQKDSIFVKDSVFLIDKGDTVYKYKNKYVYVYKILVDTFYAEREKEIEVPVPVERKLTWWERMKLQYAELIFATLVAIALVYVLRQWLARRTRKE